MEQKRLVPLVIQILIFVVVLFLFTANASDKTLQVRLIIGGFFLLLGLIVLRFKRPIAEWTYKCQVAPMQKHSSIERFIDDFNHGGLLLSFVGGIIILIGLFFR